MGELLAIVSCWKRKDQFSRSVYPLVSQPCFDGRHEYLGSTFWSLNFFITNRHTHGWIGKGARSGEKWRRHGQNTLHEVLKEQQQCRSYSSHPSETGWTRVEVVLVMVNSCLYCSYHVKANSVGWIIYLGVKRRKGHVWLQDHGEGKEAQNLGCHLLRWRRRLQRENQFIALLWCCWS